MMFTNRRNSKLKPCPLCGSESSITALVGRVHNVACGVEDDGGDSCGLVLFGGRSESMAAMVEKWNRRTPPEGE